MINAILSNEEIISYSCDIIFNGLVIFIKFDPLSIMASMNDGTLPFSNEINCKNEQPAAADNYRKKGNFRQRIRSLREECEDGPLLASGEDLTEIDDDSGFVVASRSKRGKKAKDIEHKENLISVISTTSPIENVSESETNPNVLRSSFVDDAYADKLHECFCARYPDMEKTEFRTLLYLVEKQCGNFKDLSTDEKYEKLDELRTKQDNYKDKTENIAKVPSKPVWVEVKRTSQNRVLEFSECTICLNALETDEKIILEECGHCFHPDCLRRWMKLKNVCPFCCTYSLSPDDFPKLT